jgi:hypothetical protein
MTFHPEQDQDGRMTQQVTRLLRDHATDNCPLLLQLIEGGGANRRLVGYLFGIAVFHASRDTGDHAMRLLRRHASSDTVRQAEKLKESIPYHYNESEYLGRYRNPEFDLFDFVLANKMCLWHRAGGGGSSYFVIAHQTLNLTHYAEPTLTPGFETLDFIRFLTLPAQKGFDLEASMPALLALPLENIHMENMRLERFPVWLLDLPQLRTLTIRRSTYRPRHPMQVPDEGRYGSPTLEKLVIEGYPISGESQLGPFPRLTELSMVRCGLESADFLAESRFLAHLHLRGNHLRSLPKFLGDLVQLRVLDLSQNPLQTIELDLTNLPLLEELDLRISRK